MRQVALGMADRLVGISNHTLDTFLAGRSRRPGRDRVHYYGVDPAPFVAASPDRAAFRRELGLAKDAHLLLFAGRLVPEKNPLITLDVLAALRRRDPKAVAVFAGAGSLEDEARRRAEALGVGDAVRLLGWRDDVPAVMRACDWFILPRPETPKEGFGLAVVEAQLAGLRLLLSRGIPDDPLLPAARVRRLSLAEGPDAWASAAMELMAERAPSTSEAAAALAASPMDLDFALADLVALHG
jgi:glycosyltransferase involved in cell wall biosynthesis